ncbi:MAG: hypothetical protein A2V83_00060 [Nitrospirae bacterium RBG_16_64_22]|nr:MAG: hypothetical protein A2V83_00060 [Nitrospirae bacterium RBG_16_64_22]
MKEPRRTAESFLKKYDGLLTLLDEKGRLSDALGVLFTPTHFVVDPAGRVVGASFGAKNWADPAAEKLFRSLMTTPKK